MPNLMVVRSRSFLSALCAVCYVLGAMCYTPATSHAQVPHLIRYQGQAMDSQGVPLEGPHSLTFRLYDVETGGTPMWEEQQNVTIEGGHFSVLLGQVNPLTGMDWSRPCWLGVLVNGASELTPRQRITSVPLAIRAETAEQLTVPVTTSTITDDANRLVPSGAIILWTGANCPAGYTRLSALDGKFLVSGAAYQPAAGGSNTHSHTIPSHAHSYSGRTAQDTSGDYRAWNASPSSVPWAIDASRGYHTHTFSGTTDSAALGTASVDSRPEFATILLCQKD